MKFKYVPLISAALLLMMNPLQALEPEALPLSALSLPESLGQVESRFEGSSQRHIIHIQDVHAHLLAQENIEAIVEHLAEHYDVHTVALEGNWDTTSLPKTWSLPSSPEKQMLLRA